MLSVAATRCWQVMSAAAANSSAVGTLLVGAMYSILNGDAAMGNPAVGRNDEGGSAPAVGEMLGVTAGLEVTFPTGEGDGT